MSKYREDFNIANQYRINKEYDKSVKILEELLKQRPEDVMTLELLAKVYKSLGEFEKSELLLQKVLKNKPRKISSLQEYSEIAFNRKDLNEIIKRFKTFQSVLDDLSHSDEYEKKWLFANRRIVYALLRLGKKKEAIHQRLLAFNKLNGKNDLLDILNINNEEKLKYNIDTEMFISGESCYYACKHSIIPTTHNPIVEKCIRKNSIEYQVYKEIDKNSLFSDSKSVNIPELIGINEKSNYTKLYISFELGRRATVAKLNPFNFGYALGEMSDKFHEVFPYKKYKEAPVLNTDIMKIFKSFRNHSLDEVKKDYDIIERLYSNKRKIESIRGNMQKVFAHNDVGDANVLLSENDGEKITFIDWELASFNTIGSDIGGILRWHDYANIEVAGESDDFEKMIVKGYMNAVSTRFNTSEEEIFFSYNFNFINNKLSAAISLRDYNLFKRIVKRSSVLLDIID